MSPHHKRKSISSLLAAFASSEMEAKGGRGLVNVPSSIDIRPVEWKVRCICFQMEKEKETG